MTTVDPKRGEVWRLALDPTIGSEISKTRPVVVVSADVLGRLPVRVVIPLTSWQPRFGAHLNKVLVKATTQSGLSNDTAADVVQIRCVSVERFIDRLGRLDAAVVEDIAAGVAVVVEYRP